MERARREPARRAAGEWCRPDLAHAREHGALAVGRLLNPHQLPHGERSVVDALREVDARRELLLDARCERDDAYLLCCHIDALDVPVAGEHHRFRVRREGVARQHVVRRVPFLIVALHRCDEPLFVERAQVADAERCFLVAARRVHEPAAVGRDEGAQRAAVARRDDARDAGLAIEFHDLVATDLAAGVSAWVAREVGESAVWREGHPRVRRGARLTRIELDARADRPVVHPERYVGEVVLRRRIRTVAAGDEVLAVGRPRRRTEREVGFLRDNLESRAVGVHGPEVVVAVPVGDERDHLAVGRPARHAVPRHAARDALRLATSDGKDVEVAEEIENERLAVGRDIERDPRPFVGCERDLARWLERQGRAVGARCGRVLRADIDGERAEREQHE